MGFLSHDVMNVYITGLLCAHRVQRTHCVSANGFCNMCELSHIITLTDILYKLLIEN